MHHVTSFISQNSICPSLNSFLLFVLLRTIFVRTLETRIIESIVRKQWSQSVKSKTNLYTQHQIRRDFKHTIDCKQIVLVQNQTKPCNTHFTCVFLKFFSEIIVDAFLSDKVLHLVVPIVQFYLNSFLKLKYDQR